MLGLLVFHSLKCLSNRQKYIFSTHEKQIEFWNINKHNISVFTIVRRHQTLWKVFVVF